MSEETGGPEVIRQGSVSVHEGVPVSHTEPDGDEEDEEVKE